MRRWICILAALTLLCLPAGAEELPAELTDALPSQAERLLEGETGDLGAGLSALWGNLRQEAGKILRSRLRTAAGVLFTVLLCAVLGGLREGNGSVPDFVPMAGALAIAALTAESLRNLVGLGWEAMEATALFGKALLAALALSLAAGGAVQTASMQQVGTVLFGTFLLELIRKLLLPLVYLYTAALTAAAIAPETPLRSLAEAIRKAVSWILGGSLTAFTLYLTLAGAVSGAADKATVRAAKAVLSGTVPVVGGILSDAAETLLAGAGVLRGSIGVFGTLGVLAICAYPFLPVGVRSPLSRGAGFRAEAAGGGPLPKLVAGLGSAFALVLGMTASCAAVLLAAIAAAMGAAGL